MLKPIPKSVKERYRHLGKVDRLYLSLRWMLCPYEIVEKYVPQEGIIADIGCGYGLLSSFLAVTSGQRNVVGIDLSRKRINVAKSSIANSDNVNFYVADAQDARIDRCAGVVMSDFLHHIADEAVLNLLREINDKIAAQGRLVILDVDKRPLIKHLSAYLIDRVLNIGKRLYHRSCGELNLLLTKAGFKCEIIPAHKGLPLSDVLFICQKVTAQPSEEAP